MRELLKRWAKLEPNRCANVHRQPGIYLVSGSSEIGRNVWASKVSLSDAGHVLAAVIEAIEARRWRYRFWGDLGIREAAVITVDEPTDARERYQAGGHNIPLPQALLSAYLDALEADRAA